MLFVYRWWHLKTLNWIKLATTTSICVMPNAKYVLNLVNRHGSKLLFRGIKFDSWSSKWSVSVNEQIIQNIIAYIAYVGKEMSNLRGTFFAVKGKGIRLTHLAHAENALDYAHSSVQHSHSHGMVCKHLLCLPMTTFLLYLLWGDMFFL
jgi:hypothetical protein